jgi:hypothetical protein
MPNLILATRFVMDGADEIGEGAAAPLGRAAVLHDWLPEFAGVPPISSYGCPFRVPSSPNEP